MKQTTIIIIAVIASVGTTFAIFEGIAILNQYGFSGESVVGLIDPKAKCLSLLEENSRLINKYRGVSRMENWLVDDSEKFWEDAKKWQEANCPEILTIEEIMEVRVKYGISSPP